MNKTKLTVAVAGDFAARDMVEKIDAPYSVKTLSLMRPILDALDIRLINLENAVISDGFPINKSGPNLKMEPKNLSFLIEGNFNCAILANNHVGDFGDQGVFSTLRCLDENKIPHAGAGRNIAESYLPWYCGTEAGKLALVAVCENEFGTAGNTSPGTAGFSMNRVFCAVKEAKQNADFVLLVMHGGNEHNPLPAPYTVERYRLFVEFGVDAVIGMHPHCMQGYEYFKGVPVVYSTGNFFFHNSGAQNNDDPWYYGYLPILTFEKGRQAHLELCPYRFDPPCTLIKPFEGEEKKKVLDYIDKISSPLADFSLIEKYFKGWTLIGGVNYSKGLTSWDVQFAEEKEFPAGHAIYHVRNNFTCEAHNGLLTWLFKTIEAGEIDLAKEMEQEIRKLQRMPV
jgi:poly-gamma-glutamate synthesis protein (capsule biosynthesis protein)